MLPASRVLLKRPLVRTFPLRSFHASIRLQTLRPALTVFSEDENALRDAVAQFSKEVIGPKVKEMDQKCQHDPVILQKCFEQGYMGIQTPAEYGGSEMSFISSCIVVEEVAKVDPSVSLVIDIQNTLLNTAIRKWGTSDQQQTYLPRLATDTVGSFALSEVGSGSDAFALKSTATRGNGCWILNGQKAWISNSSEAGLFLVMANTDMSKGYKGITAFLVKKDNPGLSLGKLEKKLGMRASSTREVILSNCVVLDEDVLGSVGEGYKIAIQSLNEGRIGIGAQMLGLAQGAFDNTIPYLTQRKQFGKTLASFQGVQFDIAKMATDIEAAKLLVYNAARLCEADQPVQQQSAMAKLYASQMAERVASKCVELMGGVGFTTDFPIEKYYRDCKIGQIYEGTTNIQYQTIAKSVIKDYE